jgi:uncharacterized membrane protein
MWDALDTDDRLWNGLAVAWFLACWLGYGPMVKLLWRRGGAINIDMEFVRRRWMSVMAHRREQRLIDGQLMGQALSSASFFASSNLILIAAAAGVLFGGDVTYHKVLQAPGLQHAPRLLFDAKIVLITATLARSLLDFIWAIRQLNYVLAVIGATPERRDDAWYDAYAEATAQILNPALESSNSGVRGYYFALAAAAWLIGPWSLALATLAVIALLFWRQSNAAAARGVRAARALLEQAPARVGEQTHQPPFDLRE